MSFQKVERDISWAAGVLEGEGCFSMHQRKGKDYYQCAIHCEMTDEDTVVELHRILGVGTLNRRSERQNRKPTWILSIQKHQEIFDTILRVGPYLMGRRREKALQLLNYLEGKVC